MEAQAIDSTPGLKSEYRNDSDGVTGVVIIQNHKEVGIAVQPGSTVWLSQSECIATANAPLKDEDNPLVNGDLTLVTPATEIANRRPLGPDQPANVEGDTGDAQAGEKAKAVAAKAAAEEQEKAKAAAEAKRQAAAKKQAEQGVVPVGKETGAATEKATGKPATGQRAKAEEVATPEAPAKA